MDDTMNTLNQDCIYLYNLLRLSPEDTIILLLSIEQTRTAPVKSIQQFKKYIKSSITDNTVINHINRITNDANLSNNFDKLYEYAINDCIFAKHNIIEIYNELCSVSRHNRHDLIMTPPYIYELIYRIWGISEKDIIFDPCMGLGQILNQSPARRIIGAEIDEELYSIAYLHALYCSKIPFLFCDDFRKINLPEKPKYAIMNPPYTMGTKSNPSGYEICYIDTLLRMMPKNSKVAVIVPQSTLNITDHEKTSIRNSILESNQLDGIIPLNMYIYSNAIISTCIALFTVGKPHGKKHFTKFFDFGNDGCFDTNKGHIPTAETYDLIEKIGYAWNNTDITYDDITIESHHVEPTHDWSFGYFVSQNQIPPQEIFEKTVNDYLLFYVSSILNNRSYLFKQAHSSTKNNRKKSSQNIRWDKFNLTELFDIEGTPRSKVTSEGVYPYLSSTVKNNGHNTYCDFFTNEPNCICVESAINGFSTYQEYPFAAMGHIERLIPKFNMTRCSALFIVAVLNHYHSNKYHYGYKASQTRLRNESILLPVDNHGNFNLGYMESFIDSIWSRQKVKINNEFMR